MNELRTMTPEERKAAANAKRKETMAQKKALKEELAPLKAQPVEPSAMPTFIDPIEAKKREARAKWMKEREYKSQMVTGKFLFNECPGGELKFSFREFPGDPLVTYTMRHDTIHTIPLGVAIHLNDRCSYSEFQHNLDQGKTIDGEKLFIQSKVHRTSFIPLNFTQDVGNHTGKSIAQVSFSMPQATTQFLDSIGR